MNKVIEDVPIYSENQGQLLTSQAVRTYITGGHGVCTLQNPLSKNKYTYLFMFPRNPKSFREGVMFCYVKKNKEYQYVGMLEPDLRFRKTYASRFPSTSSEFRGAKYICDWARSPHFHSRMNLFHEGICAYCGRKLIDPKSISVGVGPKCRKKLENTNGGEQ